MPSPNIAFNSIPASIRKPGYYVEFNTNLAVRTLPGNVQRVVLLGQRLTSGSVAAGTVMDIFSDIDAATFFGFGSILHLMAAAALKTNPYLSMQAVALDDASASVAATGTLTITGPATGIYSQIVTIGAQQVAILVNAGDTASVVATNIVAALNALPSLPVTASASAGVVTLTAKNKGTLGSSIKISAVGQSGIAITASAMASGATDPTIASTLSTIFAAGHNIVVTPYIDTTNLTALRTHLDNVSGPVENRGAIGIYGHVGTLSQATTLAASLDSGRITCGLVPSTTSLSYEVAGSYAALIASEEDPARPLNTLPLSAIAPNPITNLLSRNEQESALANGVTPTEIGPGGKVQIVRAITTYTVNAASVPDASLLDLTTIRTLDYVRKAIRERIALRFPRDKKTTRVKAKVRTEILDVLYKLEELEIVEFVEQNQDGVIVEDDLQDANRLDVRIPVNVVNGLHVFAARIDLLL